MKIRRGGGREERCVEGAWGSIARSPISHTRWIRFNQTFSFSSFFFFSRENIHSHRCLLRSPLSPSRRLRSCATRNPGATAARTLISGGTEPSAAATDEERLPRASRDSTFNLCNLLLQPHRRRLALHACSIFADINSEYGFPRLRFRVESESHPFSCFSVSVSVFFPSLT